MKMTFCVFLMFIIDHHKYTLTRTERGQNNEFAMQPLDFVVLGECLRILVHVTIIIFFSLNFDHSKLRAYCGNLNIKKCI